MSRSPGRPLPQLPVPHCQTICSDQAIGFCFLSETRNTVRTDVVAGKCKQRLVDWIDAGIVEVRVRDVTQHPHASQNVFVCGADVRHADRLGGSNFGITCMMPTAPTRLFLA